MQFDQKTILSLCDCSGEWPKPYKEAGYKIIQIDILNNQDVRLLGKPRDNIYGILAAPPCTVFANSGARWLRSDQEMIDGLSIVDACLRLVVSCKPKFWALENPVGKLKKYLGNPTMIFDPSDYGDPYTKKTLLWGSFNTNLPTNFVAATEGSKMHKMAPSKDRAILRSITPSGFAKAFFLANQ